MANDHPDVPPDNAKQSYEAPQLRPLGTVPDATAATTSGTGSDGAGSYPNFS